jgi:hypothetical protein
LLIWFNKWTAFWSLSSESCIIIWSSCGRVGNPPKEKQSTQKLRRTSLFCREILHVSDSSSVHHQEFIHCTLSNGICHTAFEQEHMLLLENCLQTCMTYAIAECTVNKFLMMDRRTVRNMQNFMPK